MTSGNRSNSFFSGPGIGIGRIDDDDDGDEDDIVVEDVLFEEVDGFGAADVVFEVDGDVDCTLRCIVV